jgi:hypothetical protein
MYKNSCIDCKKEISKSAKRCRPCEIKRRFEEGIIKSKKYFYCIDCNKEINYNTFYYGNKRCQKCANKGKNNPNFKDGRSLKDNFCECGKKIDWKADFCRVCFQKGKRNNQYIDGNSAEYSFEWNDELKESIRKRDNYECQNCGMTEEEHLIVIGQVLHVHHIDYDKQNCQENNLITTCFWCNIRANKNRDYWKKHYKNKLLVVLARKNVK